MAQIITILQYPFNLHPLNKCNEKGLTNFLNFASGLYDAKSKYNYKDFINNEFEKITITNRDDHNNKDEFKQLEF